MNLPDIRTADIAGKTILLRADLNVPLANGQVTDRTRIIGCAATIAGLLERNAKVVVIAHLDRPKGVANPVLSIAPVLEPLREELGRAIHFVTDSIGAAAEQVTRTLPEGGVVLLENLRFHAEEEQDDRSFALMLSVHGDIYVNDAPSSSIRQHASIHAIVPLMPAYAGPQLLALVAALDADSLRRLPGVQALSQKNRILETN